MLTAAVTLDAGEKLAGIDMAAFHQTAMAGIGKAAAHSAAGATAAAHHHRWHAPAIAAGVFAAAIALFVLVSGVFSPGNPNSTIPATPTPLAPTPVEITPAPPAQPEVTAEIVFTGGECPCGHLNPQTATLDLQGHDLTVLSWTILSGEKEIRSGNGRVAAVSSGALPEGEYLIRYAIAGEGGMQANAERAFTVLHGDYNPAQFN